MKDTDNPLSPDYRPAPEPHGTGTMTVTVPDEGEWVSDNAALYGGLWS